MITIKLSSVDAHPKEIFQALEDRKSEIMWAKKWYVAELPAYEKPPKVPLTVGLYNFIKQIMNDLRP